MTITIRPVIASEADRVGDILLASRAEFLPYAPSPHSDAAVRAWVRDHLLTSENVTVAAEAGEVIGILATRHKAGISWITQLYIHPSRVGRGIGSMLLRHALTTLKRPIRLFTFQQNSGARRFYERNGFVALALSDGSGNEERCPDVVYELNA